MQLNQMRRNKQAAAANGGPYNNYLHELSLKQITETVGSGASSRSSMDGGMNRRRRGGP